MTDETYLKLPDGPLAQKLIADGLAEVVEQQDSFLTLRYSPAENELKRLAPVSPYLN